MARSVSISIPEPLEKGMREFAGLSDAKFEELLSTLRAMKPEIAQHQILPEIEVPGGRSVLSAVYGMILGRPRQNVSIDDAVEGLVDALREGGIVDAELELFRTRAKEILRIEPLDLIIKAHSVLQEHSSTFSSARVVSDIRGVFEDEVVEAPRAAVIVHMLNISYNNAGRREAIAVALDEKDVEHLISVLERARAKSKVLKSTIEKSGMIHIGVS
jgi:hypothetical protein